ncbi:MAG TPA: hypothetical protein VJ691_15305 [Vicinamibacterales bacterium]|nr:hypothetical protein [Vicinamibacterales bacterium]
MLAAALALQLTATTAAPWVYVFTTTDCPIANRYAPEINRLAAAFAGKARFMLVYSVPGDTDRRIQDHVRKFGYKIAWRRDVDQQLAKRIGVRVTPEVAIVVRTGRDDKVLYRGRIDDRYIDFGTNRPEPTVRDLERSLEAVLAGKPVPIPQTQAIGCILSDLVK